MVTWHHTEKQISPLIPNSKSYETLISFPIAQFCHSAKISVNAVAAAITAKATIMTSYINVKNKQGLTKLATLIKEAGFNDVKVTVGSKSITLTPNSPLSFEAGLSDLKAGRYESFKTVGAGIKFLAARGKKTRKSVSRKR